MSSRRVTTVAVLAVLGVVLGAATGTLLVRSTRTPFHATGPVLLGPHEPRPGPTTTGPATTGPAATGPATGALADAAGARAALAVLHGWDTRRSAAYATGSTRRLRDLYVAGSPAGAADVDVLGDYRARGLRVVGLRTQVLSVSVVERGADRWTLRVTDRVQGGAAVLAGRRLRLPRDAASTRVLTVVRGDDARWRVARVTDAVQRPPS